MPKRSTSVPQVARQPRPYTIQTYRFQFPAPDDERFNGVDQVEFAVQYFVCVLAMVLGLGVFAAFVLVPLAGLVFSS